MPQGFHSITPYIVVRGAAEAIEFYKRAFDAVERYRLPGSDGKTIGHAEITIGDSILMLADEFPDFGAFAPQSLKGSPVRLCLYVENVDVSFKRAIEAGATVIEPVNDKFYGDRSGCLTDPYGHLWTLMTHKEDVSAEEMKRRLVDVYSKMDSARTE